MAIPTYEEAMIPVLKHAAKGGEYRRPEFTKSVSDYFGLSDSERAELLPSGKMTVVRNRTDWAVQYLHRAKLLRRVHRGVYEITDEGRRVLDENPTGIDKKFLLQYDAVSEWIAGSGEAKSPEKASIGTESELESSATPDEQLEQAYQRLNKELAAEVLEQLHGVSPEKFEQIVLDTIVAMGYGGSHRDAAQRVGKSGDEGIDGIINEDRLGLDTIYLQAKRWQGTVGRPEIQKFVGALHGKQANKGVFITTSTYSSDALSYAQGVGTRVVLVDGATLASYMIECGIGVVAERILTVHRLDSDYFEDGV